MTGRGEYPHEPTGEDLERSVIAGADAQQLLSNATYQAVMRDMREGCYALFTRVSLEDPLMQEKLVYLRSLTKVVEDFEESFKTLVTVGSSAEEALRLMNQAMDSSVGSGRTRTPSMYANPEGR
jgi:hypothetical protein